MIRALIVDDEQMAREELQALLEETGAFELLPPCANGFDAVKMINEQRPEVMFLDIEMPVINGFQLLSMVDEERMPHVVFVTAYDEFALKAFEEKTLDYLLKPVEPERLALTLQKLKRILHQGQVPRYETPDLQRIPCCSGRRVKLVDVDKVECVFTDLSGVHLLTADSDLCTDLTLKVLEQRTPLVRCHKQYLINLTFIDEVQLHEGGTATVLTRSGHDVPVSRRYLRLLKEQLSF
ncbi:two-component system response regulator BtsR [Desulfuromonas acetoxidans]|uniref:two-component system response regulator BtsR n=1 Tax=Desulfuromonas acetoxidans TaxID=891 RepID=UPI001883B8EB|nr:two-component system response regulator BtsR [Desulfuromonas acetoxidans]MBF0645428.1 two-component system response regulator BtsR [Desulfuromonas acetoxidans]